MNVNIGKRIEGFDIYYKLIEIDKEDRLITKEMKEALGDAIRLFGTIRYGERVVIHTEF